MTQEVEQLRAPPHDLDAEACTIASFICAEPELRSEMKSLVRAEHFYIEEHAILWQTCCEIIAAGKPLDAIILRAELIERGKWDDVGGIDSMAKVFHSVPSAAHGAHYATIVRNKAIGRWALRLAERTISRVFDPQEMSFPQIAKLAEAEFAKLATGASMMQVVSLEEASRELFEMLENQKPRFIPTGFRELDDMVGGLPVGGFTLVGGSPGMGKSAFEKQLALNLTESLAVGVISIEEDRYKIAANALSNLSGVQNAAIMYNRLKPEDFRQLAEGLNRVSGRRFFISDTCSTISEVETSASIMRHRNKCRVIFVDHLHLVEAESKENRAQQVAKISRTLKMIGRKLDVAMVGLCQLNRAPGQDPPTLNRFKESGNLEADGDVIIGLHRPDYFKGKDDAKDGELQVHVLKNKNGATGMIPLFWDADHQRIKDWNPL